MPDFPSSLIDKVEEFLGRSLTEVVVTFRSVCHRKSFAAVFYFLVLCFHILHLLLCFIRCVETWGQVQARMEAVTQKFPDKADYTTLVRKVLN